jgi:manganese/iron transport system substrate-binding protein
MIKHYFLYISLGFVFLLAACSSSTQPEVQPPGKLKVVATTSIIGDVVKNVGGDLIDLTTLIPVGSDPHSYEPVPQDIARVADADVIFVNGAGLEESLLRTIKNAGEGSQVISLSDGIQLIQPTSQSTPEHTGGDPHVWTDPTLVKDWVDKITQVLSERDPANAAAYQSNAKEYSQKLDILDGWIQEQVSLLPADKRQLVTDHESFAYFAQRYGFELVGAVIPSYSTLAAPSAQELANLEDAIRQLGVKAIFVDTTVNPALAERVGSDTGVRLVPLYSGSLSQPEGEAGSYLDYMRYNVNAIVSALK